MCTVQLEKLTTDAKANPLDMPATSASDYPTASWAWSKHKPVPRSQGRSPVRTKSLLDVAVHEVLQIRELLGLGEAMRVLVLGPYSPLVGHRLRASGLAGECWALVRHPSSAQGLQNEATYDQVIVSDWPSVVSSQEHLSSQIEFGRFDVIVCLELSRIFSPEGVVDALEWATSTLLSPFGYLVSGEPLPFFSLPELESSLLKSSLLLAADERVVETDWSWSVTRWQLRPGDSSRLAGQFCEITRADMERRASLKHAVVSCFRETFGGDEWGEWMKCADCHRHYSCSEYNALAPSGQCLCGTSRPLDCYHKPHEVLAELYTDLTDSTNSRLYVREGPVGNVDAFIWGSLITTQQASSHLLSHYGAQKQKRLQGTLDSLLQRQGIYDPSTLIFYMAYLGVLEQVRSLSLVRALFTRICQFAVDRGVELVIGATIPTVNTYTLLCGIGMEPVYTYPARPSQARISRLDESGVVLGGNARSLLSQVSCSERRLALHIGRSIRQGRVPVSGDYENSDR